MAKEISHDELKELQMKILDHIDDFCTKYQIRYSLSSGTLLGAVRHGGYIPWDDDIDIMMLREDYEKFTNCYKNESSVEYYQLLDHHVKSDYSCLFMKIHDTRTLVNEDWQLPELGIYVDIFPIDKIPCNQFVGWLQYWIISFLNAIIISKKSQKKTRILWKQVIVNILSMFPVNAAWDFLNWLYKKNSPAVGHGPMGTGTALCRVTALVHQIGVS